MPDIYFDRNVLKRRLIYALGMDEGKPTPEINLNILCDSATTTVVRAADLSGNEYCIVITDGYFLGNSTEFIEDIEPLIELTVERASETIFNLMANGKMPSRLPNGAEVPLWLTLGDIFDTGIIK